MTSDELLQLKTERAMATDALDRIIRRKKVLDRQCDELAHKLETLRVEVAAAVIRSTAHEIPAIKPTRMELV